MTEQELDHHDMEYYDKLVKLPKGPPKPLPYEERKRRFGNQSWRLVQENKGGSATVPTQAYPDYELRLLEKPAPPTHPKQPSTSSSSTY